MSVFPGDMNIGWGFGIEGELPPLEPEAPQQTEPLLAVSELEQRLLDLQGQLLTEQSHKIEHLLRIQQVDRRITDLEERLRNLSLVVDELYGFFNELEAQVTEGKEGETN